MKERLNLLDDIYYSNEYLSLYLKKGEELFDFKYEEGNNFFINKTIKRPIRKIGDFVVNDGYYDLESAYGYGGFYSNSTDRLFLDRVLQVYLKRCKDEKIIAEFMRFHPFNNFPLENKHFFDFNLYDRDVVYVSLEKDILASYTSKVRNIIKRASEKVAITKSDNIEKFVELYTLTMKKNDALKFYFFNKVFFDDLYNLDNVELYEVRFENEIVAMGFFIFGEDFAHYHLSANGEKSYNLNANYALLYRLSELSKDKGKKYFLLGGGLTSSVEDSLFRFKKKFSKETKQFYISGKIYNQNLYEKYVKLWEKQSAENIKYFLKYRLDV